MARKKEKITITCYDETKIWESRAKAKAFYLDCMMNSEGREHDRYTNIYEQLCCGYTECCDEDW